MKDFSFFMVNCHFKSSSTNSLCFYLLRVLHPRRDILVPVSLVSCEGSDNANFECDAFTGYNSHGTQLAAWTGGISCIFMDQPSFPDNTGMTVQGNKRMLSENVMHGLLPQQQVFSQPTLDNLIQLSLCVHEILRLILNSVILDYLVQGLMFTNYAPKSLRIRLFVQHPRLWIYKDVTE